VSEDPALAQLLVARLPAPTAPRAVSVTDLIAPRRAFWRALAPVAYDAERQRRLDVGRALHHRLGVVLSSEGALEVRVRQDGLVGRIDLLSDVPVEVKTTASSVAPAQLREARPDQVEQLAMYCALTARRSGRLITLVVDGASSGHVQAVDIEFGDPTAARAEMQLRAASLRRAWGEHRADALPACRWYGRGCEFQDSESCDCRGGEPGPTNAILSEVGQITERTDVAERIESHLQNVLPPSGPHVLERFRDLLYLRHSYYERAVAGPPPKPPPRDPNTAPDLYSRLVGAIETGPLGEVARIPSRIEEPEEEVGGFRGMPFLVRTSRGRDPASPTTLLDRQPQYALELGFRCVATGASAARLVLGRELADRDAGRVQVFEYRFAPASTFARLWRERTRQLANALAAHAPGELPACPDWLYATCPYRSECACGTDGTRSQR
jgi:hypothetical protein